jgi:hypothetical protein
VFVSYVVIAVLCNTSFKYIIIYDRAVHESVRRAACGDRSCKVESPWFIAVKHSTIVTAPSGTQTPDVGVLAVED